MWQYNFNQLLTSLFMAMLILTPGIYVSADEVRSLEPAATFEFTGNKEYQFLEQQKTAIRKITLATIKRTKQLMPELLDSIHFKVLVIDRDLSRVNGTTGRADRPNEIEISFSSSYKDGLNNAIEDGLAVTLFHELHHTVRGWTIYGNKFPQGIDVAAINEGLADVFAEIQAGHPHSNYSDKPDYDRWTKEILALPKNANYGEWMFSHPDGREAIGYRTGAYLIKKAMKNSGKGILELSKMSVTKLYKLAGY